MRRRKRSEKREGSKTVSMYDLRERRGRRNSVEKGSEPSQDRYEKGGMNPGRFIHTSVVTKRGKGR